MKAWLEEAAAHEARLREALREAVERTSPRVGGEWSARELSRRLGRSRDYLYKVLRGNASLKVDEITQLLGLLGILPHAFFFECFPWGGELEARLKARQGATPFRLPGPPIGDMLRLPEAPITEGVADRATFWMRVAIRRGPHTQAALSEALRFGSPHALGLVLRGRTVLTYRHVFRVLAALGKAPGRFFVELLGPPDALLKPGLPWSRFLDVLEARDQEMLRAMAERPPGRGSRS